MVSEKDQFYQHLVDLGPDGIFVIRDTIIVYANRAAVRMIGAPDTAPLLGKVFLDLFDPPSIPHMRQCVSEWWAGMPTSPIAVTITRPDGSTANIDVTGAPFEDGYGEAVQVVIRDITERERNEQTLRKSEERLRLAFAGAQEGVWDWSLETDEVYHSPQWIQMLGYCEDEIEPYSSAWKRLLHPDDRLRAMQVVDGLIQGERAYQGEFRVLHKEGHYIDVLTRGFPVRRGETGPVVRIVGTHLDLTERKRAEEALREREERLTLAFAGAQEGVWDWNLETGAAIYSPRYKQMLGYAEDEIAPSVSAWENLLHREDAIRASRALENVYHGEPTYEGEFRLLHKDGHYLHVLTRGFPVRREPEGPVVRMVGTLFDLTERKHTEEVLRRAQGELETRVLERTAELARTNAALREEIGERIRAERARTELHARLVFAQEDERRRIARDMHDQFGEQLTGLALRLGILKIACADQTQLLAQIESMEIVTRELDRNVDLLVWELRPTVLDDLGLLAALEHYVEHWGDRTGIETRLHTLGPLDERLASGVETTLYRIAQEALTNVAKHSKADCVDVILERRSDQVLLIVEDNGIGFEPMSTKATGKGSGILGMRERAALAGATLQLESAVGKGTTLLVQVSGTSYANRVSHA